jgi:DNA-directed RNA polymerase II subunit RPB1
LFFFYLHQGAIDENDLTKQHSDGCGRLQPIYRRVGCTLTIKWKSKSDENQEDKSNLSAAYVLEIFKAIPDRICQILGMDPRYARTDWMILTVLPVPPLCVRPSVLLFGTARSQDDLTYNLANILKANKTLLEDELRGVTSHIMDEHVQCLQFRCAALINNDIPGMPQLCQKSGKPLKCLKARLTGSTFSLFSHRFNLLSYLGKEGRIRGNLMGKRVDFSARTVNNN